MALLELDRSEAQLLTDIMDWWLETHADAERQVQEDRTHATAEGLLKSVESMRQQRVDVEVVRERLWEIRKAEEDVDS
jgi:hypothetical protein